MTEEQEVVHGEQSPPLIGDGNTERRALERWPEQRALIRALRASMPGVITLQQLINRCIVEDIFDSDDLEAFVVEGIKRRVLNAVPDMRAERRG